MPEPQHTLCTARTCSGKGAAWVNFARRDRLQPYMSCDVTNSKQSGTSTSFLVGGEQTSAMASGCFRPWGKTMFWSPIWWMGLHNSAHTHTHTQSPGQLPSTEAFLSLWSPLCPSNSYLPPPTHQAERQAGQFLSLSLEIRKNCCCPGLLPGTVFDKQRKLLGADPTFQWRKYLHKNLCDYCTSSSPWPTEIVARDPLHLLLYWGKGKT